MFLIQFINLKLFAISDTIVPCEIINKIFLSDLSLGIVLYSLNYLQLFMYIYYLNC